MTERRNSMEAKHLMIGDWMDWPKSPFANPHFYSQVVSLERGEISPCIGIPLTPEILEKNGLKYEADYGRYHRSILGSHAVDNKPLICIEWNPEGEISQWEVSNKSGFLSGVVAYGYTTIAVHQLQQILRSCGLHDLADNFQI